MINKKTVNESTPKSVRERVLRRGRVEDPTSGQETQMVGRVVPKKTGNSDPRKGGKHEKRDKHEKSGNEEIQRRYSKEMQESILFLHKLMTTKVTKEEVEKFQHRALLSEIVNHLIAVGLGGWREEKDQEGKLRFINESGHVASPRLWTLTKSGKLRSGVQRESRAGSEWNLDKLFEIREMCNIEEAKEDRDEE